MPSVHPPVMTANATLFPLPARVCECLLAAMPLTAVGAAQASSSGASSAALVKRGRPTASTATTILTHAARYPAPWAGVEGRGVSAALAPSPRYRPQSHHCSRLRKRGPAAPGPGAWQQALQQAVREELISHNVAKLVRVPSPRYKNRQRPFSVDRVPTILGAVKGNSKRPPPERAAPTDSRDTVRATRRTRCPSWSGMANEVIRVEDSVVVEGKRRSFGSAPALERDGPGLGWPVDGGGDRATPEPSTAAAL
jgi:hypothetical protein